MTVRSAEVDRADRLSFGILAVYLVVAVPLILLELGRYRFFFSDEWTMIAGRDVSGFGQLFRPDNAHWTTIPALSYSVMWHLVGLRSYLPYQAVLVVVHVAVIVLLRLVMRGSEINPWVATAAAASLVLFGPGGDDITWAFQITFTGALAFGLIHLLLANVEGPVSWRRYGLGMAAGLAALMCSGVGTVMAFAVAAAVLIRRGWRAALAHLLPLAGTYALYVVLAKPQSASPAGRPPAKTMVNWLYQYVLGVFMGIGRYWPIAVVLAILTVCGFVALIGGSTRAELQRKLAGPVSLAAAAFVFSASTALGRWQFGTATARSSRYLYLGAALLLPLVAVSIDALRRRWPLILVVAVAVFIIPIPGNATSFESPIYNRRYFAEQRRAIYYSPQVSFAADVPRDVRPVPNPFIIPEVNIGFLRDLQAAGELRNDTNHVPPAIEEEMRVRLGVAQRSVPVAATGCRFRTGRMDLHPRRGSVFVLNTPVTILTAKGARIGAAPVTFRPINGRQLTIDLPDLDLIVRPSLGTKRFEWCRDG